MPVQLVKGDLFAAKDLPALGHGCNCAGAMGKGIALEFKKRYPDMYKAYRELCLAGEFNLGDVFVWEAEQIIFNLATQKRPGSQADIQAIETALQKMVTICDEKGIEKVGLPKMGAGLGQLEWETVEKVIKSVVENTMMTIMIFEYQP